MNTQDMITDLQTDSLLLSLEPGVSSRTKIAVGMARKLKDLTLLDLSPEQALTYQDIKSQVDSILH